MASKYIKNPILRRIVNLPSTIRNIGTLFWHIFRNIGIVLLTILITILKMANPIRGNDSISFSKHDVQERNLLVLIACLPLGVLFLLKNTKVGKFVLFPLMPKLGNFHQHRPKKWQQNFINYNFLPDKKYLKLSIVTPSYQHGEFLERTLISVISQGYPNLEYIVQDGGSKDSTTDILKKYNNDLKEWESTADEGQTNALNVAFNKMQGCEIMAYLNSDDLLLPGSIEKVMAYFENHPEIDVVYGNRILINEQDLCIGEWILPGHDDGLLSYADYVPQETLFWRSSIWEKSGAQFDETFKFAMDWDLLLRFRSAGAKFAHIPNFIGAFRIHTAQKTQAIIEDVGSLEMDRLRMRELGYQPSHAETYSKALPFLVRHVISDAKVRYFSPFN